MTTPDDKPTQADEHEGNTAPASLRTDEDDMDPADREKHEVELNAFRASLNL
ncbi:hypothetical protein JL107_02170 [Nakamurella flavida]|uniref:Uncharacterized protein n=1 Tax=Nakamurella flavida TaxID=363630 RepID=A0A939BZ10_9ACTN|nr:hypothetical protein [Nakamurella flavida]MBM9475243.1 hypothetical protein [Nakamurella flavida]MDP9776816.1 hypothetical protein [Nakamurella flavida]